MPRRKFACVVDKTRRTARRAIHTSSLMSGFLTALMLAMVINECCAKIRQRGFWKLWRKIRLPRLDHRRRISVLIDRPSIMIGPIGASKLQSGLDGLGAGAEALHEESQIAPRSATGIDRCNVAGPVKMPLSTSSSEHCTAIAWINLLIFSEAHLRQVLKSYAIHYDRPVRISD